MVPLNPTKHGREIMWQVHLFGPQRAFSGGVVQKSMGHKVTSKIGMIIYHPVTSRPLVFLQKEAASSPCNFATAHLTALCLHLYLSLTLRPMKRRTLGIAPKMLFPSFLVLSGPNPEVRFFCPYVRFCREKRGLSEKAIF